jgi:hypothetical protein
LCHVSEFGTPEQIDHLSGREFVPLRPLEHSPESWHEDNVET